MTTEEFIKLVSELGLPDDIYSLDGGLPGEAYVMERAAGENWKIYYSERGQRSNEQHFLTEDEALNHLYTLLLKEMKK